jgi:transposase-like protein
VPAGVGGGDRTRLDFKRALREILYAATISDAQELFDAFVAEFSPKYEKAAVCLVKGCERLLSFFEFPADRATGSLLQYDSPGVWRR